MNELLTRSRDKIVKQARRVRFESDQNSVIVIPEDEWEEFMDKIEIVLGNI